MRIQPSLLATRQLLRTFRSPFGVGGGGVLGIIFALYVPLDSQSRYSIIVYSVANYRPQLSHFWANM